MKKQHSPKTSQKITLVVVLAIVVLAFVSFLIGPTNIIDFFRGLNYQPSEEMSSLIADIDLTGRGSRIIRASRPTLLGRSEFNASCSSYNAEISVLGCFDGRSIYIYDVDSEELAGLDQATLAHELLHAIWYRTSSSSRSRLTSSLNCVADKYDLFSRLELYAPENWTDELHSIVGTEISDFGECDNGLSEYYSDYFVDRSRIVSFFSSYNETFQNLKQEADAMLAQIDSLRESIAADTINYEDASADLSVAILDFNRRADNGYFTSQSAFNRERNELNARIADLTSLFDSLNTRIDEVNALIDRYNANIAHTSVLQDALNSNSAPPDNV